MLTLTQPLTLGEAAGHPTPPDYPALAHRSSVRPRRPRPTPLTFTAPLTITFGDTPGHAFHGNQHTGGLDRGDPLPKPTLRDAIEHWAAGGRYDPTTGRFEAPLQELTRDPNTTHPAAKLLLEELTSAPRSEGPLYRGETAPPERYAELAALRPGDTVTLPPIGTSTAEDEAVGFSTSYAPDSPNRSVLLELEPGFRSLDVNQLARDLDIEGVAVNELEVIAAGPARVVAVREEEHPAQDRPLLRITVAPDWAVTAAAVRVLPFGDTVGHDFHGNQWTGGFGGKITPDPVPDRDTAIEFIDRIDGILGARIDAARAAGLYTHPITGEELTNSFNKVQSAKMLVARDLQQRPPLADIPTAQLAAAAGFSPTYDSVYWSSSNGWQVVSFGDAHGTDVTTGHPAFDNLVRDAAVGVLIHNWASTSNDSDPTSLAIQEAVVREFGLKDAREWDTTEHLAHEVANETEVNGATYQAFVRAEYDATQELFQELGVDTVPLWRGTRVDLDADVAFGQNGPYEVELRPMSSFTLDRNLADGWASDARDNARSAVLSAEVPVERIIGTPATGVGCLDENEMVVLGGGHTEFNVEFRTPVDAQVLVFGAINDAENAPPDNWQPGSIYALEPNPEQGTVDATVGFKDGYSGEIREVGVSVTLNETGEAATVAFTGHEGMLSAEDQRAQDLDTYARSAVLPTGWGMAIDNDGTTTFGPGDGTGVEIAHVYAFNNPPEAVVDTVVAQHASAAAALATHEALSDDSGNPGAAFVINRLSAPLADDEGKLLFDGHASTEMHMYVASEHLTDAAQENYTSGVDDAAVHTEATVTRDTVAVTATVTSVGILGGEWTATAAVDREAFDKDPSAATDELRDGIVEGLLESKS